MNLCTIKKLLKTIIRCYGYEATDKEIPKVGSSYTCLAVISLDSVLKNDGDYYLQVFLSEYK